MVHTFGGGLRLCVLIGALIAGGGALGWADSDGAAPASERSKSDHWLLVGARVGAAYELTKPAVFNDEIQQFYPSAHSYFPLYSRLGLSLSERFPIGDTGWRLALTQLPMISGIDQNYAIPSLTLLVGIQTDFGLEVGLGPQVEPIVGSGGLVAAPSLVYSAGWRLSLGRFSLPLAIMVDPLPPQRHLWVSVTAGIDYGFTPSLPKPRAPFNY